MLLILLIIRNYQSGTYASLLCFGMSALYRSILLFYSFANLQNNHNIHINLSLITTHRGRKINLLIA